MVFYRRRKGYRAGTVAAKRTGRKLNFRQKKQVKRIVGRTEEHKFADTFVNTNPTPAGVVTKIISPAQGDADNQRDGDTWMVRKLQVQFGAVFADGTNFCRFIICRWRDNDGAAAPVINDIMNVAVPGPLGQLNWTNINSGRLKIIYDRLFALNQNGDGSKAWKVTLYGKRLGKKKIVQNPGAQSGVDQFYTLTISDSNVVPHPFMGLDCRLSFTDS